MSVLVVTVEDTNIQRVQLGKIIIIKYGGSEFIIVVGSRYLFLIKEKSIILIRCHLQAITRYLSILGKDLDEAKISYSVKAFRASAVMSRRSIQSACIDKGAFKEKLVAQLHELAANRVITNDLKEWADVMRWVGNDAAHPDKQPVNEEDAQDILNLAEQFRYVIYVAPAIAKEQRTKRGKT
jgi:hypothetical protein